MDVIQFHPKVETDFFDIYSVMNLELVEFQNYLNKLDQLPLLTQTSMEIESTQIEHSRAVEKQRSQIYKSQPFNLRIDFGSSNNGVIAGCVVMGQKLAESTFSYIYDCQLTSGQECIAKVIKNKKVFFDQSLHEYQILMYLGENSQQHGNIFL